jgi:predicted  nucleic acid-binding Zn-ribbon protein
LCDVGLKYSVESAMSSEDEITALKRIVVDLETKLAALEQRVDGQKAAIQEALNRIVKLEKAGKNIRF